MSSTPENIKRLMVAIECHDPEDIAKCFSEGLNPNSIWNGEPLLHALTSEYSRGPQFGACVRAFFEAGIQYEDQLLVMVLLDDAHSLDQAIRQRPNAIFQRRTLRCAYTPLREASLLHIAAEFNRIRCAEVLISKGVDVNVTAGTDDMGFGAQTPIFHCVNQNRHASAEVMELLLDSGADPLHHVKGILWGKGYEWETFIPSVNAISYAMMGLLPQMHRNEHVITQVVCRLLEQAYGIVYQPQNIPNAYLRK